MYDKAEVFVEKQGNAVVGPQEILEVDGVQR